MKMWHWVKEFRHKITYTDDCTEIKILKNPTTCNAFLDGEAIMKNQESDCHKTQDDGFLCRGESGQWLESGMRVLSRVLKSSLFWLRR